MPVWAMQVHTSLHIRGNNLTVAFHSKLNDVLGKRFGFSRVNRVMRNLFAQFSDANCEALC